MAGDAVQQQRRVAHGSSKRPIVRAGGPEIGVRPVGHDAKRRLEAKDAAQGGRDANRAGTIRAMGNGPDTCRDGRGRTATAAARRAFELPRIASGRSEEVVARILVAEVRRVGLAENNCPGGAQATGDATVKVRDVVLEELRARSGAQASGRF